MVPTSAKATVGGRRSRVRSYLLLARVSNLPTVWTNVLAAYVCARAGLETLPIALVSLSLFYTAGMFLNDVCDAPFDARARADRPIPNGDVRRGEALAITVGLFLIALALLWAQPHARIATRWGVALIAAIAIYDVSHKGKWYGPMIMGLCRALVYCVAASSVVGTITPEVFLAGGVMWLYVIALTWIAKAANLGYAVPWLLAGICVVDAVIVLSMGEPRLALISAVGCPLTLALQRVVPGT
jgi:4-hydroxybenzoate polyprenyltransferase